MFWALKWILPGVGVRCIGKWKCSMRHIYIYISGDGDKHAHNVPLSFGNWQWCSTTHAWRKNIQQQKVTAKIRFHSIFRRWAWCKRWSSNATLTNFIFFYIFFLLLFWKSFFVFYQSTFINANVRCDIGFACCCKSLICFYSGAHTYHLRYNII